MIIVYLLLYAGAVQSQIVGNRLPPYVYKPFTVKRIVCYSLSAISGIAHGFSEAQYAEPTIFESRWGVKSKSFFGSDGWENQYYPSGKHRPEILNFTRDYHHLQNAIKKSIWIGVSFSIGLGNNPISFKLLDLIINTVVTTAATSITYSIMRKQ